MWCVCYGSVHGQAELVQRTVTKRCRLEHTYAQALFQPLMPCTVARMTGPYHYTQVTLACSQSSGVHTAVSSC